MATTYQPLSVPRHNPTERDGLREREPVQPLMATIEERCGEMLIAAFLRCANAWFTDSETRAV